MRSVVGRVRARGVARVNFLNTLFLGLLLLQVAVKLAFETPTFLAIGILVYTAKTYIICPWSSLYLKVAIILSKLAQELFVLSR